MSMALKYGMMKKKNRTGSAGEKGVHPDLEDWGTGARGESMAGAHVREGGDMHIHQAKDMHRKKLQELKSMDKPDLMAHGGEAGHQSDADDMDMIGRIMHRRAAAMSEGGMIANEGDEGVGADEMPNEFDDMALDDHLEFHDTGANSGDELGNSELDHDESDIVSRIMRSRSKKDRNPSPA